jgi:hypothetical protein
MIRKFRKIFRPTATTLSPTKTDYVQAPFNRDAILLDDSSHVKPVPSSLNKQFLTGRAQHSFPLLDSDFLLSCSIEIIHQGSFFCLKRIPMSFSFSLSHLLTGKTWCASSRYLFILRNETHLKAACVCAIAQEETR